MLKSVDLYYFSPTGGTLKAAETFCRALAEHVTLIDLGVQTPSEGGAELAVAAMPVFAGRIPSVMPERIRRLKGQGRKAVALAVYGVRAYDDALLELCDLLEEAGFEVIAAAALIAEHSIVREVGKGRPDAQDAAEIRAFAEKVEASYHQCAHALTVPGNRPYREGMKASATPASSLDCNRCGACAAVCPTGAIRVEDEAVTTELSKCMMCMACTAVCPQSARALPAALQEGMNQRLGALKDVRRENEFFI